MPNPFLVSRDSAQELYPLAEKLEDVNNDFISVLEALSGSDEQSRERDSARLAEVFQDLRRAFYDLETATPK